MNDLLKRLNMKPISDFFDECYEKALKDSSFPEWLTEKYIREIAEEFPYFSTELENIISSLDAVTKIEDIVLFAKTIYIMLGDSRHPDDVFAGLEFPKAPEGENPLAYDIFSFYPVLARTRDTVNRLLSSGADEEIVRKSFAHKDGCVVSSTKAEGRYCLNKIYFLWLAICKNAVVFRVGRFNFELREGYKTDFRAFTNKAGEIKILMNNGTQVHSSGHLLGSSGAEDKEGAFVTRYNETKSSYEGNAVCDEDATVEKEQTVLSKDEWSLLFKSGDNVISIHIPGEGGFSKEIVDDSIKEGKAFFKKLYPDKDIKGIICVSWLSSPVLKELLKSDSNIIGFQNRFTKFPRVSKGLDVFNFVFKKSVENLSDIDFDSLSENTTLERKVKEVYKSGRFIYETGGIFKF